MVMVQNAGSRSPTEVGLGPAARSRRGRLLTALVLSVIGVAVITAGWYYGLGPESDRCSTTAARTEGPYFVDGAPSRSDIRGGEYGVTIGLQLTLFQLQGDSACSALEGATVDIWHANASGLYSGVATQGTSGLDFLRGSQVTNQTGGVAFTTIYP